MIESMKFFFETLKSKNELLFYYGLFCFLLAGICFVATKTSSIQLFGVSIWLKPFKFFLSVTILAWTMGYFMQFLNETNFIKFYSISFVVLLSIELFLIVFQAFRNQPSHFNQIDSLGKFIFSSMAIVITIFMLLTAFVGAMFFIQKEFEASEVLVTAIKWSFVITVIFAFEGFAMGALLKHTVGANDGSEGLPVFNWSKNHGDLRVAHFFGLHALQFIPMISILIAKTKKDVLAIALIYFLLVSYTCISALQGKPFWKW